MLRTDRVLSMPVTRDLVRRVARSHAAAGRTVPQAGLFPVREDQAAYERAFHEHARQHESEIAECA